MAAVTAVFTLIAGALKVGGVAAFLIKTAVSFGLSALAAALQRKKMKTNGGLQTDVILDGEEHSQSFIIGRTATAGQLVYINAQGGGTGNRYLQQVVVLSDIPVDGLENEIIVNGRLHDISTSSPHPEYGYEILGLDQHAWVKFYDGNQTTVDPGLLSAYSTDPDLPINSNFILTGCAYAIITFRHNAKLFSSIPETLFIVRGIHLEQIAASGFNYTDNPVRAIYNILRGINMPDGSRYGVGVEKANINQASFMAAASVCDEDGHNPGGTWRDDTKRYRCGVEIPIDAEPLEVLGTLLESCGAELTEVAGTYYINVGPVGIAADASISDNDVIISDSQSFDMAHGLQDTFNKITCTHPSCKNVYEPTPLEPVVRTDWLTDKHDGRELVADLQLNAVPYPNQCRRLMREYLNDSERARQHQITLPPKFLNLNPLDVISWTSVRNGYSAKKFEIKAVSVDPMSLNVTLTIRERDPADYDYDATSDNNIPGTTGKPPQSLPYTGIPNLVWAAITAKDGDGLDRRVGIRGTWDGEDLYSPATIQIQIKVLNASEPFINVSVAANLGNYETFNAILPNTTYQCRARLSLDDANTEWSSWVSVSTADVGLSWDEFEEDIRSLFEDAGLKAIEDVVDYTQIGNGTYQDQLVWDRNTQKLYQWNGTAWVDYVGDSTKNYIQNDALSDNLVIPRLVTTLPPTGTQGEQVFHTPSQRLYVYRGGSWEYKAQSIDINNVSGQITAPMIAAGAITGDHIQGGTITGNKIVGNTITGGLIAASGIITNSAQINNGLITTAKINDAAIVNAKISDLAVDRIKIADGSVTTHHYVLNAASDPQITESFTPEWRWVQDMGVTFTRSEIHRIAYYIHITNISNVDYCMIRLQRGGNEVSRTYHSMNNYGNSNFTRTLNGVIIEPYLRTGYHHYTLHIQIYSSGNAGTFRLNRRAMVIEGFHK